MFGGQLPADDHAGENVDHEAEEDHSLPGAQVGEIGHPKRIGPLGAEVAIDQVGLALSLRIGRCGAPGPPAALGALDSVSRHQPLHGAAGALDATAPQLLPGAP